MTKAHFDVFKQSLPPVNHEQFPKQMTQAQQVAPNPRPGRFSTETPPERERRLQIQREQRRRRRQKATAEQRLHTAKATPTTRDRNGRLESEAL